MPGSFDASIATASYNQDFTHVIVATRSGYAVHSTEDGQRQRADDTLGALRHVEMLFSSSLLCVVGEGDVQSMSPRRIKVLDARLRRVLGEIRCASTVTRVRLNRARIVAREATRVTIHELGTLRALQTMETANDPLGLLALSAEAESSVLAYADGCVVKAHDALNLCGLCEVRPHRSALAAIALNADGTMLATASVRGTVIRVTALPSGTKCWSFRRGATSSQIQSLNFGATTFQPPLLCVSSDKGTAHVFAIEGEPKEADWNEGQREGETSTASGSTTGSTTSAAAVSDALNRSRAGVFGRIATFAGTAMTGISNRVQPGKVIAAARNAMEPARAIAMVKLPHTASTKWSLCALQPTKGTSADKWAPPPLDSSQPERQLEAQLSVVTSDGVFYDYNVRLSSDRAGFFSRGDTKEAVARLERECKLVDETHDAAFGSGSTVGELPRDGRWIESRGASDDVQELRTNVSESMSQSMFDA